MAQEKKKRKALLHKEISQYFVREYANNFGGKELFVLHSGEGKNLFFEMDPETYVCEAIHERELASRLSGIGPRIANIQQDFALTFMEAIDCVKTLAAIMIQLMPNSVLTQWPETVAFADGFLPTMFRLPFSEPPSSTELSRERAPEWCAVRDRLSNFDALAMWVWSLLVKSDRSQYVWIYGEGDEGKSLISAAICSLFGDINAKHCAWSMANPENFLNRFWYSTLVGKRLCYIAEGTGKTPVSDKFKALTGDDIALVEAKGEQPYNAPMTAKFLFCSNDILELTNSKANVRRVIYCTLLPFQGEPRNADEIKQNLIDEMPEFLAYGRYLYENRKGQRIPTDTTEVEEIVMDDEQHAINTFEFYFEAAPGELCPSKDVGSAFSRSNIFCRQKQHKYYLTWKKLFGIEKKMLRVNGKVQKFYIGMKAVQH